MSCFDMNTAIVRVMKQTGYYQEIMGSGADLDRVKEFLSRLGEQTEDSENLQRPEMACFPELESSPFLNTDDFEAVQILESQFDQIADEASQLNDTDFLTYYPRGKSRRGATSSTDSESGQWLLFLFRYMGARLEHSISKCRKTYDTINRLPHFCGDYPWGDALISQHLPGTHLKAHCSIDNLRVRIHLGLDIPAGCEIRVGREIRAWRSGKCLVFDDSFEHETWNRSDRSRTVLIVDLWHPGLTEIEKRALLRGFNNLQVKQLFFMKRLTNIDIDEALIDHMQCQLEALDQRFS